MRFVSWFRSSCHSKVSIMNTQETAGVEFLQSGPPSRSGRSDAELLKQALLNEKAAPEILQFETDLISRIEGLIDYQAWREIARPGVQPLCRWAGHRGRPGAALLSQRASSLLPIPPVPDFRKRRWSE